MKKLFYIIGILLLAATGYYLGFESRIYGFGYFLTGLRYNIKLDVLTIFFLTLIVMLVYRALTEGRGKIFLILSILCIAGTSQQGGFKNNAPRVFNIELFGAKGDGVRITGVSMGATSTTLTGSGFTSADVGKSIRVPGAGSSGHDLVTTIAAFTNSTTITLTAASVGAVSADTIVYGTDNTTAIQTTVWADSANGGGKIWVPNGVFCTAGSLITSAFGANPNCQIYFPVCFLEQGLYRRTHYVIEGETPPNYTPSFFADTLTQLTGSVIYSLIDGSGNLPAVFGTKSPSPAFQSLNYNYFTFKNLTILVSQNRSNGGPSISGINMWYSASLLTENVLVSMDGSAKPSVKPTNEVAGIVYNAVDAEIQSVCRNTQVTGFKYGMIVSDGALIENGFAFLCQYGLVFAGTIENVQANHMKIYWCNNDILVPNATICGYIGTGAAYFNITNLLSEVWPGTSGSWYDYTNIIVDAGNNAVADINYTIIQAGGSYNNALFNKSGGTGIRAHAIGSSVLPYPIDLGPAYNSTGFAFRQGDFTIQSDNLNNTFIGGNTQAIGAGVYKAIIAGAGSRIHFSAGGNVDIAGAPSVSAGSTQTFTSSIWGGTGGNAAFGSAITGTPLSWVDFPASTTAFASANIPEGTAPTSPASGDHWAQSDHNEYARYNSTSFILAKTLTGTGTLDFPSTGSTAVADLTITVTGAATGDVVVLGVPAASVTTTASFSAWVSSANTVTVRFSPKATEDPASGTFRASIIRY